VAPRSGFEVGREKALDSPFRIDEPAVGCQSLAAGRVEATGFAVIRF
jgi:hypothetical protein